MAQVFRADDTALRREVAVKVLYQHLLRDPSGKARFVREARAAAALDHPSILKVFDVDSGDEEEGVPYIVMELIRGRTLKAFLDENGPPLAEVVALAGATLADALAVAHAAGVVHRDVKPANVMVTDGGRLVLCDFGVARVVDDDALATQSGMVLGTPAYMPPEQAMGRKVDERSDVYSLGATLYQLATGAPPFTGSASAVMQDVMRGRITPPLRRNPTMGGDLAGVIEKAMAREAQERPQTARALKALLDEIVAAVGLGPEELKRYFEDPAGWNQRTTPRILAATVERARASASLGKVARALALAERVLAIDPGSAEANSLVARLGVASRRRRQASLLAGSAVAFAVAALLGSAWAVLGRDTPAVLVADAAPLARLPVPVMFDAAPLVVAVVDAAPPLVAIPDAATGVPASTTGHTRSKLRIVDAGVGAASQVKRELPDAAPAPPPAAPERATLEVRVRPWCDITIDGEKHGRSPGGGPISLEPGAHKLKCEQPTTGRVYEENVDLGPGQKRVVTHDLVGDVAVKIGITGVVVMLDGKMARPGASVTLPPGRHSVELMRAETRVAMKWVQISQPCTLRDSPELACYEE